MNAEEHVIVDSLLVKFNESCSMGIALEIGSKWIKAGVYESSWCCLETARMFKEICQRKGTKFKSVCFY